MSVGHLSVLACPSDTRDKGLYGQLQTCEREPDIFWACFLMGVMDPNADISS